MTRATFSSAMPPLRSLALLALAPLAVSAQATTGSGSTAASGTGATQFVNVHEVAASAGLGGVYTFGNTHTGGVAWIDYNGDLLPDLFVSNGGGLQHFLFRNQGDGTFVDVSNLLPKPDIMMEDAGGIYGDIDNDGDYDLFIPVDNPAPVVINQPVNPSNGGPNLLFVNNGDGTFTESAAAYGVLNPRGDRSICGGFADYDLDGSIDLYVGTWCLYELPLGVNDDYDMLLHNHGDGTFEDVTSQFGTDGGGLDALTCLWFDSNFDRYPEIYVGNVAFTNSPPAFVPIDNYYMNGAAKSFTDQVPIHPEIGDDAWASMGLDVGDVDNDGDWDLYITDIYQQLPLPYGNVLYLGSPDGTFADNSADVAGISADNSWPCGFVDFDQDQWIDLWVGTTTLESPDFIYLNNHDGTFRLTSNPALQGTEARGGAHADYDGDGDMDFAVWMQGHDLRLYRNDIAKLGTSMEFKLIGESSNKGAVGALVHVTANGITNMRRVTGGDSAHSQADSIIHFGVGNAATADVTVDWPSGKVQNFTGVATGNLVQIDEDAGIISEGITDGGSSWNPAGHLLDVRVKSNYGGRTHLHVDGLGDLRYDAESRLHRAVFRGLRAAPKNLTIHADRGGSWVLPLPVGR